TGAVFALGEPLTLTRQACILQGHTGMINCVVFSPDGRLLATGGQDETVRLWNPQTGDNLIVLRPQMGIVLSVAFTPDGEHLIAAGREVKVYRLTRPRGIERLSHHAVRQSRTLALHPTRPLALTTDHGNLFLWDLTTGRMIQRWDSKRLPPATALHWDTVFSA